MRACRARPRRDLGADRHGAVWSRVDHRPDLVILDLGLPDIDGRQVLRMLRAVSDVPVIVATRPRRRRRGGGRLEPGRATTWSSRSQPTAGGTDPRGPAPGRGGAPRPRAVRSAAWSSTSPRPHAHLDGAASTCAPRVRPAGLPCRARPGEVVTKRELMAEVWQPAVRRRRTRPSTCTCRGCAASSASPPSHPRYLTTVRGVGVRLAAPVPTRPRRPRTTEVRRSLLVTAAAAI